MVDDLEKAIKIQEDLQVDRRIPKNRKFIAQSGPVMQPYEDLPTEKSYQSGQFRTLRAIQKNKGERIERTPSLPSIKRAVESVQDHVPNHEPPQARVYHEQGLVLPDIIWNENMHSAGSLEPTMKMDRIGNSPKA